METIGREPFIQTAAQIAAKLCRDAIWAGNSCNWLGDSREQVAFQPTIVHRTLGPDVYGGTSGIGLFLARIFQQANERLFRINALGAITHALSRIEDISSGVGSSYYSGRLGIAHTAIQMGSLLNHSVLIEEGLSIAIQTANQPVDAQMLDVIAGSASAIPTFLHLYSSFGRDEFLQAAIRHGEHLLTHAVSDANGYSWQTISQNEATHNLCGLAHGAGGIGLSLLELHSVTKEARYLNAGRAAFHYEQQWFDHEEANYPDFRLSVEIPAQMQRKPRFMMAWCHGAPGIGIVRLRAYELLRDEIYRQEAEQSIKSTILNMNTMQGSDHNNYSLCHGLGGNAILLLIAAKVLQNESYRQIAHQVGIAGIAQHPKNRVPWRCGVLGGGETPNLMLGTAGIGHFYLSLYDEDQLPPLWLKIA